MGERTAIYPFCPEILPAVKLFEALQETYSVRYLVSPREYGYSGKDAGYACNHPDTGLTVSNEIPYEALDWDTLIVFSPMMKKGRLEADSLFETSDREPVWLLQSGSYLESGSIQRSGKDKTDQLLYQ